MNWKSIEKYALNCFLLTIPILVWDLVFTAKLPIPFQASVFWKDIPPILTYGENSARTAVFVLTLLMPLSLRKKGVYLYAVGILVYFSSWLALIFFPNSLWSQSIAGFMAPAYTPLFWLTGIGLCSHSFYFQLPYKRWFFILTSLIFLILHASHTYIIYCRTH